MKKINKFCLILFFITLSSCGQASEDLPMSIFIRDASLYSATEKAIEALESVFGDLFIITENEFESRIQIECDKNGWLADMRYLGYAQESGLVLIDCTRSEKSITSTTGHELWHMLGFWEHSEDASCLSSPSRRRDDIKDKICQEMIDEFYEKYPEAK